ncbi:hypothetical protein ACX80D_04955 [Arthrobacter sp. Sr24]
MSNTEHFDYAKSPDAAQESVKDGQDRTDTPRGEDGPQTVRTHVSKDVESDPALNDGLGQDWADEGGATPKGPATSSE